MNEPLVILRSTDSDGATYALSATAPRRVRDRFGDAVHLVPRVYVAHADASDYAEIHGSTRGLIAQLLTGLAPERLGECGEIRFLDAVSERDLGSWSPSPA